MPWSWIQKGENMWAWPQGTGAEEHKTQACIYLKEETHHFSSQFASMDCKTWNACRWAWKSSERKTSQSKRVTANPWGEEMNLKWKSSFWAEDVEWKGKTITKWEHVQMGKMFIKHFSWECFVIRSAICFWMLTCYQKCGTVCFFDFNLSLYTILSFNTLWITVLFTWLASFGCDVTGFWKSL